MGGMYLGFNGQRFNTQAGPTFRVRTSPQIHREPSGSN